MSPYDTILAVAESLPIKLTEEEILLIADFGYRSYTVWWDRAKAIYKK